MRSDPTPAQEPIDWLERTRFFPEEPGVYLMKDHQKRVIYVGKAKSLRARVSSYFQAGSSDYRAFIGLLSELLAEIETIVVRSEKEALILERELIRTHQPKFNVIWRDDKQYLCLRVDDSHEFPWVQVVRQMGQDGARYFGPFHSATAARSTLRVANRHFQLRTCRDSVLYARTRPCLEYQIGRCPAPCVFEIDREQYHNNVKDVIMFLEGRGKELSETLEKRMWADAEAERFEIAARSRDQIRAIRRTLEPQHAALASMRDQDAVGFFREDNDFCVALVGVRSGRIKSVDSHFFGQQVASESEVIGSFLLQFYAAQKDAPDEVLVPLLLPEGPVLEEVLEEKCGRKVRLILPRRGERKKVLELAQSHAEHAFFEKRQSSGANNKALEELRRALYLSRLPRRMECFDISNLQGDTIVGSQVTFIQGVPAKGDYRHYKVRTTAGQDDFGAMFEVLNRRLRRGKVEGDLPDLMVIDGGKGQLQVAKAALSDLGIESVDLCSLAKSRVEGYDDADGTEKSAERVFLPGVKDPLVLPQRSAGLLLLTRIRDEAHRFAIRFHRRVRGKAALHSELDNIPGIGKQRRRALLSSLGSKKAVEAASLEALMAVPGLGPAAAERVFAFFHGKSSPR